MLVTFFVSKKKARNNKNTKHEGHFPILLLPSNNPESEREERDCLIRVRRREKGYERERREGYVRKGREGMEGVVYCGVASFSFLFFLYGQKKTKRTVCLVIHVSKAFLFSF